MVSPEKISVRPVMPSDGKVVEQLMIENGPFIDAQYKHIQKKKNFPSRGRTRGFARDVRRDIENGNYRGHIATSSTGKAIGFAGYSWQEGFFGSDKARGKWRFVTDPAKPWVKEVWLIVDQDFIKKGIATMLRRKNIVAIRKEMRKRDISAVDLLSSARSDNFARQGLDKKSGFRILSLLISGEKKSVTPTSKIMVARLLSLGPRKRTRETLHQLGRIRTNPSLHELHQLHYLARKRIYRQRHAK